VTQIDGICMRNDVAIVERQDRDSVYSK
jgi:hypothetical protein